MRLFLALEPSAEIRSSLARLQDRLRPASGGWRWVRPAGIHLTLRFLGEVGSELDARARPQWRRAVARARRFRVRPGALGRFPQSGTPRVLWVGLLDDPRGALVGLARSLEECARGLEFAPEKRPFRPHLTLARAGRSGRPVAPGGPELQGPGWTEVHGVTLFSSRPDRAGARYTALEVFPLEPREAPAGEPEP